MTRKIWLAIMAIAVCGLCFGTQATQADVVNGSFETGDFTGWIVTDFTVPFEPAAVLAGGTVTAFDGFLGANIVIPTDGSFAANHGFDGDGPGVISIAQDVGIISDGDILTFDYRAGWDLASFGASLDRSFSLLIEPSGGGFPISIFPLLVAPAGTDTAGGPNSDTGPLSASFDLSAFAGFDARINFLWSVPELFSGPANAQLDNVRLHSIPEPGSMAILGLLSAVVLTNRRRK